MRIGHVDSGPFTDGRGPITAKLKCSGGSEREKIQDYYWDQIIVMSTLILLVRVILPLLKRMSANMCECGTESFKSTDDLEVFSFATYSQFHCPKHPYGLKLGLNGFYREDF